MTRARHLTIGLSAAMLAAAVGSPAQAQQSRTFMTLEHGGLASVLTDPRDAALRDALAMIPGRIGELPHEIEDMPPEAAGFLQLALETMARPARVAVMYDGDNPSGGFFGYGFIASIEVEGHDDAAELQETILEITEMIAEESGGEFRFEPSSRFEGMSEMLLPFGLLSFGPRESQDGWRYEMIVGTMNEPDQAFGHVHGLVDEDGFESWMTASLDFETLTPLTRIVTNFAGANAPEAGEFIRRFEEMGIVGEDAIRVEYEAGTTPHHAIQRTVIRGAAPYADELALPQGALTSEEIDALPADVYAAAVGRAGFDSLSETLEGLEEYGIPVSEAIDEFEELTGVHLVDDILENLGGTFAFYNSDTTGGGSLLSTVLMITIDDHESFGEAIRDLAGFANDTLDEEDEDVGRYVNLEFWESRGVDLLSLRFPGIPVPLELTFAMTDDWFIAAPSPQAALAAGLQASGRAGKGLTSNPRFAKFYQEHAGHASSVSFVDNARTLQGGYGFMSLMASAISNAVRSPEHPDARDPGMILPLYGELVGTEIIPTVRVTRWHDEDLVTTTWTDTSVWVQTGGSLGAASAALPLIAAGMGAAVAADNIQTGMLPDGVAPRAIEFALRHAFVVDPLGQAAAVAAAIAAPESSSFDLSQEDTPE